MNHCLVISCLIVALFAAAVGGREAAPPAFATDDEPVQNALPLLVGHRGASADAPENTLAAFEMAFRQGADVIEGDFWLTADGHIVAHHDRSFRGTGGKECVLEEMPLEDIQSQRTGTQTFNGVQIPVRPLPLLHEVLETLPDNLGEIFIELKSAAHIVPVLAEHLRHTGVDPRRATIISFDAETIAAVRSQMPGHRVLWIVDFERCECGGHWTPSIAEVIKTAKRIGAHGVDLNANLEVLTAESIAQFRRADLPVHVWTVNDATTASRLIELGVDSITTDCPAELRAALNLK